MILIVIQGISIICCGVTEGRLEQDNTTTGRYDLNFAYTMIDPELTFNRLIVMPRDWDKLFLNLSVQNYGEPIDTILTSIKINDVLTEYAFSSNERVGLKNCLVYQFDHPQTLIIPLNYSYQEILSVSISIHLDSLISWREVEYKFEISTTYLHGINLVQPLSNQSLIIMPGNFKYVLQSSQTSYFGKRLLLKSFIAVEIPDNMHLSSALEITILGAQIEYVTIGTENTHALDGNLARINTTVNKNDLRDQIWHMSIYIIPFIDSHDNYSIITVSLRAHGILHDNGLSNKNLDLTMHPIPGFIMTPVLIFLLFGIPYYYVYQEELKDSDDRIIDSDLGRL
jgi:hypothetical protein